MPDLTSRPFNPDPSQCCEACAFNRGKHEDWCLTQSKRYLPGVMERPSGDKLWRGFGRRRQTDEEAELEFIAAHPPFRSVRAE